MKHVPIRPPRNMIEEQVFARHWKELMESKQPYESGMIGRILIGYPYEIDQRVASVLASMVCWLGTQVGKSFLMLGDEIREKTSCAHYAHLAAWGVKNARIFGMNSRARQIEFLTRTQADMERDIFPEVSVKDLEALEQLCLWLGTDDGREFVAGCEAEIVRRQELETLAFHCAAGRADSPAVRRIVDKFAIEN
jgi:hypothetical protein